MARAPYPKDKPATVDAFLATLPADQRAALETLREQVHAAAPGAEEVIAYGVPSVRWGGRMLLSFGAGKHHCAFYPGALVDAFADELEGYETAKGTIRFTPDRPLSPALVERIVKAGVARNQAANDAARAKRKARG